MPEINVKIKWNEKDLEIDREVLFDLLRKEYTVKISVTELPQIDHIADASKKVDVVEILNDELKNRDHWTIYVNNYYDADDFRFFLRDRIQPVIESLQRRCEEKGREASTHGNS